jgi:hypothetical protein
VVAYVDLRGVEFNEGVDKDRIAVGLVVGASSCEYLSLSSLSLSLSLSLLESLWFRERSKEDQERERARVVW